ncbi:MAG: DUF91 domain-containing protein [Magnetococcales bacterium]|nr:DUF91 domain-containing protein [Magnetococcales bacterium]
MSVKRVNIVIPKEDGGFELYRMKEWLRQHPDRLPPGLDATTLTSYQLRDRLKKHGWSVQNLDGETRLTPPGDHSTLSNIQEILGDGDVTLDKESPDDTEFPDASFGLEYQLRDFIAQNIGTLEILGRSISLYVDASGREGIEYPTSVGPIDILAVDNSGAFFVFELKRARSPDHTIGQLTRYMGWIGQTIGRNCEINGIIVAREISGNLRYSISVIPNIHLFEYKIEFHLNKINSMIET